MKRYFEYNREEYYGLVVVETKGVEFYGDKADEIYHKILGDDDIEVEETEYNPDEVTKEYAFWKLANCRHEGELKVSELLGIFNEMQDTCIVVDGSLI